MSLTVRPVTPADLPAIGHWHREHHAGFDPECLPALGWIVPSVAAGFMWLVENRMAMVDALVTSNTASADARAEGLKLVIDTMERYCEDNGIRRVFAISSDRSVGVRCVQHGLRPAGQFVLYSKTYGG